MNRKSSVLILLMCVHIALTIRGALCWRSCGKLRVPAEMTLSSLLKLCTRMARTSKEVEGSSVWSKWRFRLGGDARRLRSIAELAVTHYACPDLALRGFSRPSQCHAAEVRHRRCSRSSHVMAACAPGAEKIDLPYLHFWRHRRAALCLFIQRDGHGERITDLIEERLSVPAF